MVVSCWEHDNGNHSGWKVAPRFNAVWPGSREPPCCCSPAATMWWCAAAVCTAAWRGSVVYQYPPPGDCVAVSLFSNCRCRYRRPYSKTTFPPVAVNNSIEKPRHQFRGRFCPTMRWVKIVKIRVPDEIHIFSSGILKITLGVRIQVSNYQLADRKYNLFYE